MSYSREQRQVLPQPVGVVDVSRSVDRAAAIGSRQANQLAGVLGQASDQLARVADTTAKKAGEDQAWADPMLRDEQGNLAPPSLEQGFLLGTAENTRRQVLASRYGSEFVLENQASLTRLHQQHPNEPDKFLTLANAHREAVMQTIDPALRPVVGPGLGREIARHHDAIAAARMKRDREETLAAGTQVLAGIERDLASALRTPARAVGPVAGPKGLAARVLDYEARNQGPDGMAAVAHVIANRARLTGMTPDEVVAASGQFEPYGNPATRAKMLADPPERFATAQQILDQALAGGPDPTGGATHFLNPDLQAKLGRNQPSWAPAGGGQRIGAHVFYRRDGDFKRRGPTPGADSEAGGGVAAPAPPSPAADQLRTEYAASLQGMVRAGVLLPAQAAARMRHVEVVMPIAQAVQAEALAAGPEAGVAISGALLAGPGHPGWRPEWQALAPEERQALSTIVGAVGRHGRAEADYARVTEQREAQTRQFQIDLELVPLNEKAATVGLSEAESQQRAGLLEESAALAPKARSTASATIQRGANAADRAGEKERDQDALARDSIGRSMEFLNAVPDPAQQQRTQALVAAHAGRDLPALATLLAREANEAEARMKAARKGSDSFARLMAAMGPEGRARVDRSAEFQALGMGLIASTGAEDVLDPRATPMIAKLSKAGALPQEVVSALANALEPGTSPERLMAAARVVKAMEGDPQAQRWFSEVLGTSLTRAYEGMAERLAGVDLKSPQSVQEFERVRSQAARMARNEPILEDALESLAPGAGEREQRKVLQKMAADTASAQTGWFDGPTPVLPPALDRLLQRQILEELTAGVPPALAGKLAMRAVEGRGWGVSDLGSSTVLPLNDAPLGGLGTTILATGAGGVGRLVTAQPRPERQWTRHPPEQYAAPFGAGGTVGTRWINELMGDLAKQAGLDNAASLRPGVSLRLVPSDDPQHPRQEDGKPPYRLMYQDSSRAWHWVMLRNAEGKTTAAPLLIDLRQRELAHRKRWGTEHGEPKLAHEEVVRQQTEQLRTTMPVQP